MTLTSSSLVLTTPQTNVSGVAVQAAVTDASKSEFTIYLTATVTAADHVAWFVIG